MAKHKHEIFTTKLHTFIPIKIFLISSHNEVDDCMKIAENRSTECFSLNNNCILVSSQKSNCLKALQLSHIGMGNFEDSINYIRIELAIVVVVVSKAHKRFCLRLILVNS